MKVYIAASWKHEHAVTMLTSLLRDNGHDVASFVENNYAEGYSATCSTPFEKWVDTESGEKSFRFDTENAMTADVLIYIGPSGTDAWAEVGAAFGAGKATILGLWAKGEPAGLMRKMVVWCGSVKDVLDIINDAPRDAAEEGE